MNSEDPEDPENPNVQYFKSIDLSISTPSFRAPCFSNQGEVLPGQDILNMAKKLRIPFQLLWSSVTHRKFGSDFQLFLPYVCRGKECLYTVPRRNSCFHMCPSTGD